MARAEAPPGRIRVELAFSPSAGRVDRLALTLPAGSTLGQALQQAGWTVPADARFGVWGKLRGLDEPLRDLDRVEVYRPLSVDPKEARRLRYRSHRKAAAK
jgi:uncharacterized protein